MKLNKKNKIILYFSFVFVFLLTSFVVFGFWLYQGESSGLKLKVFQTFSLPIGKVGDQYVYFSEVEFYQKVYRQLFGKDILLSESAKILVENKKIEQLAKNLYLSPTDLQVSYLYKSICRTLDCEKAIAQVGINKNQFTKKFLLYFAQKENLRIWYNKQEDLHKAEYKKAKQIQSQAFDSEAFSRLAKNFSEDSSAKIFGGSEGYKEISELDSEIYNCLEKLKPNQTNICVNFYGLHILRLEGKDLAGENGTLRYSFKNIYISLTGFEAWLSSALKPIESKMYLKLKN